MTGTGNAGTQKGESMNKLLDKEAFKGDSNKTLDMVLLQYQRGKEIVQHVLE